MTWTKKQICSFVDLTSLNSYDSLKSVKTFLADALDFEKKGFPVAAVCLFPNFSAVAVNELKNSSIKTAVVAGNFPNAQGFLSTKLNECELALEAGVDEIDIVINLGEFDTGDYDHVVDEIRAFKGLMPEKSLKVILETGYLKTPERIRLASELAIKGGADFIKTSTGKEFPGATLEAVEVMAEVIAEHKSERKVGLKISGGVRTYEDALAYFEIVEKHLGKDYMTPDYLRIGASSLVRNLMND
ncbi:deoxyribose-phosphate aldolase [Brumimicrobium glaciale]|uniref:Deoxyribose-phosphate aldolase n=1 Tax=Brumimicrobium glaciale TaxID=200475 RepID=A0A4Q4KQ87_9FLAO|nr:deoxyribose-phosphate aldolase [Brumimicrobium glaciale]RYM35557.1 deoxyribose-phosphate aldolase [Brumimicrobium glaciale]